MWCILTPIPDWASDRHQLWLQYWHFPMAGVLSQRKLLLGIILILGGDLAVVSVSLCHLWLGILIITGHVHVVLAALLIQLF